VQPVVYGLRIAANSVSACATLLYTQPYVLQSSMKALKPWYRWLWSSIIRGNRINYVPCNCCKAPASSTTQQTEASGSACSKASAAAAAVAVHITRYDCMPYLMC
jgi:hypothetical protein